MLFAVGAGIPRNMLDGTAATGVETVILPPYAALPSPVASHADLLIHPLNGVLYTFGGYYRIAAREIDRICENSGFELRFIEAEAGELYPKDVPLCAKRMGDMFISNPRTAPEICRSAGAAGLHIVPVSQGYAACSTAVAGDGVITADAGIAAAAHRAGITVLEIAPGHIDLPGYGYGFIGGACGFCAERGEVWFAGDPLTHPDGAAVVDFVTSRGFRAFPLGSGRLFDCGGMFFF